MATQRLDQDDPHALSFEAEVIAHGVLEGTPTVVLDRSAFYPESGGQLADRGVLGGQLVRDVQLDDDGRDVHHLLAGPLPAVGTRVRGEIDAPRRRLHMALHTAQHLLSRALVELAGAETVSSRLGESVCTVDVDRDGIAEARIAEAEALVQGLVDEDRPVRAWFPEPEELASLPLRRAPKARYERIRVVDAGGFDLTPCGGTHVQHTAQIGLVRVLGVERYKGGTRVSFSAGSRARRELLTESAALRDLARSFQTGAAGVAPAVERLREQLDQSREEAGRLRAALARTLVRGARTTDGVSLLWVEDGGLEIVRQCAAELGREGADLVVVAGPTGPDAVQVVLTRGPRSAVDVRPHWARIAAATAGRGGGRPERVEGRLPATAGVWDVVVAAVLETR